MRRVLSSGMFIASFFFGCYIAAIGIGNPADARTVGGEEMTPVLGMVDSPVEVYVFTDWFCPACRIAETEMEKAYPEILKVAKLVFVDFAMHPESVNFTPYSLSFVVREKAKYLEIRKTLVALAQRTKEPTQEDVQKAVDPLGVKYRPLNFSDINAGMKYFSELARIMGVDSTPTVVFLNKKTRKTKTLSGMKEITRLSLMTTLGGIRAGR